MIPHKTIIFSKIVNYIIKNINYFVLNLIWCKYFLFEEIGGKQILNYIALIHTSAIICIIHNSLSRFCALWPYICILIFHEHL